MAPFGYQWFSSRDQRPHTLLPGIQAAAPLVDAFLDAAELERHRLADHQLAILGFSQRRHDRTLRRAAPTPRARWSPRLLGGADRRRPAGEEALSRPPVFLVHGDAAEVVAVHAMYAAVAVRQAAGVPVHWRARICRPAPTRTASPNRAALLAPPSAAIGAYKLSIARSGRPSAGMKAKMRP
jgi:phospholipase/carboxylesterase